MLGLRGAARVKTVLFILFITAVGALKIERGMFLMASNVAIFTIKMV